MLSSKPEPKLSEPEQDAASWVVGECQKWANQVRGEQRAWRYMAYEEDWNRIVR